MITLKQGLHSYYECKGLTAQKIFSQIQVFEIHSGQESPLKIYLIILSIIMYHKFGDYHHYYYY